jgi:5'-3' exoribonuclease 2
MNQQRSRRFRAAQEAQDKETARAESILLWEGDLSTCSPWKYILIYITAMGKEITDTDRQQGWDTNAITPGTPFMTLLAVSLRYWVVHKINTDPGWKNVR